MKYEQPETRKQSSWVTQYARQCDMNVLQYTMSHNKLQYTMITTTNMKQYDTTYNDIQQKGATICYNLQ